MKQVILPGSILCVSLLATLLAAFKVPFPLLQGSRIKSALAKVDPATLLTTSSLCLGPEDAEAKIVMFGDYECPPCRLEWPSLRDLALKHEGKLAVHFQHFPLTNIHPNALDAAVAAEYAKAQGRFPQVHDFLYSSQAAHQFGSGKFQQSLDKNLVSQGVDPKGLVDASFEIRKSVVKDMNTGRSLGVSGTPTFFLITRKRNVYLLNSIADAESLLRL